MSRIDESFLVGLLGSGINASLTPPMHEMAADQLGIRYLYRPLNIDALGPHQRAFTADDCGTLLSYGLALGYNAFNITYPCKQLIMQHLDQVSEHALQLGAVNTVVIEDGATVGYNTDYSGFSFALDSGLALAPEDLDTVLQLGAGGAGSATAYALLSRGVKTLFLFDISAQQAQARASQLQDLFPSQKIVALTPEQLASALASSRGLVNATPIGMHHHPGAPLDLSLLRADLWVADVIYLPQDTPLITAASALGARTLPGGLMAVGQAVDAFTLITGQRPDIPELHRFFLQETGNELPLSF